MNSDDIYYRLSFAERVLDHLKTLETRAVSAGRELEYTVALDTIKSWLRADPTSFGEPTRDYTELRLTEYAGSYGPLSITYTVHWDLPLVIVARPLEILHWAGF
jgi:hypothetical protein